MEAIALVPLIKDLLGDPRVGKKEEGLALVKQHIGLVGILLTDTVGLLEAEASEEKQKEVHFIASVISFYGKNYPQCIEHMIRAGSAWFAYKQALHDSLSLYFRQSANKAIQQYMRETKEKSKGQSPEEKNRVPKEFIVELLHEAERDKNTLPLSLLVASHDVQLLRMYIEQKEGIQRTEQPLKFIVEALRGEECYAHILDSIASVWENQGQKKNEAQPFSYSFLSCLVDAYIQGQRDAQELLRQLGAARKEAALTAAFLLHDRAFSLAREVASGVEDREISRVLKGAFQAEGHAKFLAEKSKTDFALLSDLSKAQSSKLSMNHMALSLSNGIMNGRTSNDTYLRKNLEWMRQAKNWAKFVVASSFGMIHTSRSDPFEILRHYLPMASIRDGEKDEPESGGALFALGLLCVDDPGLADSFLSSFLDEEQQTSRSYVQHGACLGLGLIKLQTNHQSTLGLLRNLLYSDDVISSEAAAYGIGLVSAGHFDEGLCQELLTYAKETEHEKVKRAVHVCAALMSICTKRDADPSAPLSIGAAFAGTGDLSAVRRLLTVVSTATCRDTKRAAVFSIGLVLATDPDNHNSHLCSVLEPLAQSHSPHVRAGVALTLGMFLAGTGCKKALALVEVLMYDTFSWVRQHASIGAGFLLMQQNCKEDAAYKKVVEHMHSMTRKKSDPGAARFGALLGRALMDAMGKNGVFSLYTGAGTLSVKSICGAILFVQYWYWYPLVPFISLGFRPTLLLAVDTSLQPMEEFDLEVSGPEQPFRITNVHPGDSKKSHKKFRTLPLAGDKKEAQKKVGASSEEAKEKQEEEKEEPEEKHIVRNGERLTPQQKSLSVLVSSPSVIFCAPSVSLLGSPPPTSTPGGPMPNTEDKSKPHAPSHK